ncbi:MAG TPA: acyltransferase [Kribbella sp.]|nr:acyltransferase [Kribbella sp.]
MTTPQGLTSVEHGAALSHPRPEILALTGLRGLAAVAVVVHHVGVPRSSPAPLRHLVEGAGLGVPLFFLLSGFVLAYNYPMLSLRSGQRALGRYAMARVARLAPLTLVVGAAVLTLSRRNGDGWARTVFGEQAWFIAVAIVLYAAFPVLVPLVAAAAKQGSRGLLVLLAVAFGVQLVVLGLRLATGSDEWLYRNPLSWIPEFLIGMALAFLLTGGLRLTARTAQLIQAACLLYAVVVAAQGFGSAVKYGAVWSIPLGLVLLTLAAAPGSWPAYLLSTRFGVHLGVISLGLFLTQEILLHGLGPVRSTSLPSFLLVCCWVGLTLLIAEGAHRYVGVPGRRWVMALARRLDRRTGPVRGEVTAA